MTHRASFASVLSASFVLALAACEHHTPAAPTTVSPFAPAAVPDTRPVRSPPIADVRDAAGCPMDVPGTRASVVELDDGVALDLITPGDVLELRRRVRAQPALAVTDLDHGARVTVVTADADARHALTSRAAAAAGALNRGDCGALVSWVR